MINSSLDFHVYYLHLIIILQCNITYSVCVCFACHVQHTPTIRYLAGIKISIRNWTLLPSYKRYVGRI